MAGDGSVDKSSVGTGMVNVHLGIKRACANFGAQQDEALAPIGLSTWRLPKTRSEDGGQAERERFQLVSCGAPPWPLLAIFATRLAEGAGAC